MIKLKALKCDCCGGQIDRKTMKCKFCGIEYYIRDDIVLRVETHQSPVKEVAGYIVTPREFATHYGEDYKKYVIEELAKKISFDLVDCMQIENEYDPVRMEYITHARIKAIKPCDY